MIIEGPRLERDAHPAASERIETILNEHRVSYFFEPALDLGEIRMSPGRQVRRMEPRSSTDLVDSYVVQMRQGAVLPAIVVADSFEMIDGYARLASAIRCRAASIPAYVCADVSALEALSLAVELNQMHGERMTDAEIRNFVIGCVRSGVTIEPTTCARITGVRASAITRWIAIERSRARAAGHGLSINGMSDAAIVAVGAARLDPVFVELVAAASGGRTPASVLRTIVSLSNAAASEWDAVAVVRHELAASLVTDSRPMSTRRSHGSALHLGGLLRFDVADLLDVAPERRPEAYVGVCMVRDLLDAAISAAESEWQIERFRPQPTAELVEVG